MLLIIGLSSELVLKWLFNLSNRGIINDIVTLFSEESLSAAVLNGFRSLIILIRSLNSGGDNTNVDLLLFKKFINSKNIFKIQIDF